MFDRKKYKNFALRMLKGRWKVPVLMTLITLFISALFSVPSVIKMAQSPEGYACITGDFETMEEFYALFSVAAQNQTGLIVDIISEMILCIVSFSAISVYLKMSRSPDPVKFSSFIEGFTNWWKAALGFLWMYLWIFVWSLLFFIPGIVKSIAYSQMFLIMNEFEEVSVTKSMRISMIITKGHKMDLFIMYLSFIGWEILSVFTLGILQLWLKPYKELTYMNAFHALLKESLELGLIKPEDLQ